MGSDVSIWSDSDFERRKILGPFPYTGTPVFEALLRNTNREQDLDSEVEVEPVPVVRSIEDSSGDVRLRVAMVASCTPTLAVMVKEGVPSPVE